MPDMYQCPGESQPIAPAIHLARLASHYPACRTCQHRHATQLLPRAVRKRLEGSPPPLDCAPEFDPEGVQGVFHNQLTLPAMRRLSMAYALVLGERMAEFERANEPVVVLAGDGRPLVADFLAAAAEGLRYGGCHVRETSAATSAMLIFAMREHKADGALLLGAPADRPHALGLKFWGPDGLPCPAEPDLAAIERLQAAPISRPTRTAASAGRVQIEPDYLRSLRPYFHALRPLRFVLDTPSATVLRLLKQLLAHVACTLVEETGRPSEPSRASAQHQGAARLTAPTIADRLAQRTLAARADFGLWIDGDGEAMTLVDERGHSIGAERLLGVFGSYLRSEQPGATIVVEPGTKSFGDSNLKQASVAAATTRHAMAAAMAENNAALGGGSSGRYWLRALDCDGRQSSPGAPDALHVTALLLTILSRRDWPLSEVVGHALEPGAFDK